MEAAVGMEAAVTATVPVYSAIIATAMGTGETFAQPNGINRDFQAMVA